jgi:hypothetical protein
MLRSTARTALLAPLGAMGEEVSLAGDSEQAAAKSAPPTATPRPVTN